MSKNPVKIRLDTGPKLRKKEKGPQKNQNVAAFRASVYQHILALMEMVDRLSLDMFFELDCYGLEWHALARKAAIHYKVDTLEVIAGLQELIMSKEGTQNLPQGLFRNLLEFLEQCGAFSKWARGPDFDEALRSFLAEGAEADPGENRFLRSTERLKRACLDIQQHICIFENERDPSEEGFFG